MEQNQIIFYQTPNGDTTIEVKITNQTIWLTLSQIAELFRRNRSTISRHLSNIYRDGELRPEATVAKNATVQIEGDRSVERAVEYYNLDAIISVGYRVNSIQGTQFRIWASNVLKEYLLKGYAIDEKRLKQHSAQLDGLKTTIGILGKVLAHQTLNSDEATGLLNVITDYSYALDVLDKYDHQQLGIESTTAPCLFNISYKTSRYAIDQLKDKFGGSSLFGNEKDESFKGSIAAIYQTFDGIDLYPSVEEKAANLLYFVVKNHSFSDGNKRIAAYLFVWFLDQNKILYRGDGTKRIADNALVALTLMIAESKPEEQEMMVKVVVSLINSKN